ncbi:helix-turn-helix domain-containing protein [Rhizobium giardinii]|uniref:helix-turn-helix domain-containing protein n=1 Tax=Rhizobium giardinii TaxID=56731 RepID=UPI0039DF59E0
MTRGVLKLLEDPRRKRPDLQVLAKVRAALEEKGVEFLDATEETGEGVRYLNTEERGWTEMVRHARALLDVSLDQMAELSMVGRYTISRVERGGLVRPPEDAIRRLRDAFAAKHVLITPDSEASGASVRFKMRMS